MTNLTVLRGLPGSGKTTWAKNHQAGNPGTVRLSRDDMRENFFGSTKGILSNAEEMFITKHLEVSAEMSLKAGYGVIVDSTNLRRKYVRAWHELAIKNGATFHVQDLRHVLPGVCSAHDTARHNGGGRHVGWDVINNLAKRFINHQQDYHILPEEEEIRAKLIAEPLPYARDDSLPKAFIVDIDGTLALHEPHRGPYDVDKYHLDRLNEPVAKVVSALAAEGYSIVYLSGRHSDHREATSLWLKTNHLPEGALIMREDRTRRDDLEKLWLFRAYVEGAWAVHGAIDDRDRVVAAWRSIGLTCFQVADGNF